MSALSRRRRPDPRRLPGNARVGAVRPPPTVGDDGAMPSTPPEGDAIPPTGPLPAGATAKAPLAIYVHVPFCATRCGYCDFNTYTAGELGSTTGPDAYVAAARAEIRQAREQLSDAPPVDTIFFGGGTPTLLPPAQLTGILDEIRTNFGLADNAEVTTEANPETVTPAVLQALLAGGFTRISLGMQSAAPHVLATLDRVHSPGRAVEAAKQARAEGFNEVSLDLIYGTPGERPEDWKTSLDTALSADPTHVSAYALVVEDGTALARKVNRGEIGSPDDDALADRYVVADEMLSGAGLPWYEVSNWGSPCRHNLAYWRSNDWWGIGPGAHSHVGGTRWWNVRHPAAYAQAVGEGRSPAQAREVLDADTRMTERVLLGTRLAEGHPIDDLPDGSAEAADQLAADGLIEARALEAGRIVPTLRGRLLADTVVRALLP
jgi:putative oxygen-independent coproporphyrinogen III oxidase